MASMRAGADVPARLAAASESTDVLAVAAELRWERPDLTGELADHVFGAAEAAGDRDRWLHAAGWAVHARSSTGDGRPIATTVLEGLGRWREYALAVPAAHRLRVELALVAIGTQQTDRVRELLVPVLATAASSLLRADARTALAQCAMEDAPGEVLSELRNARAAWSEVAEPHAAFGLASVELVAAAAHRRAGRPDASAAAATAGLSRLRGGPDGASPGTSSGYLTAALTTEWISALLDTGRVDEAQDGCEPLFSGLGAWSRPCRQLARLRLTVARAVAPTVEPRITADALAQAARDAVASDAPDLEATISSALAALWQQLGQPDAATAALQVAELSERRDMDRDRLVRAALAAATVPGAVAVPDRLIADRATGAPGRAGDRDGHPDSAPRLTTWPRLRAGRDAVPSPMRAGAAREDRDRPPAAGGGVPDFVAGVPDFVGGVAPPAERDGGAGTGPPAQWPWIDLPAEHADDTAPTSAATAGTQHPSGPEGPEGPEPAARTADPPFGPGAGGAAAVGDRSATDPPGPETAAGDAGDPPGPETAAGDRSAADPPGPEVAAGPAPSGAGSGPVGTAGSSWSPAGEPLSGWPWLDRSGESPIGDQLMERLRASPPAEQSDAPGPQAPIGGHGGQPGPEDEEEERPRPIGEPARASGATAVGSPWTTGRWAGAIPAPAVGPTGPIALVAPAPAGPSDRPNDPITSDARVGPRPAAGPAEAAPPVDPASSPAAGPSGPAGTGRASADLPEPNSRLRAALDDLDRAWTLAAGRPPAASGPDVPLPPVGSSDAPGAAAPGASAPAGRRAGHPHHRPGDAGCVRRRVLDRHRRGA